MIEWTIEAALESGCFDHVYVSTEDSGIAEISSRAGAEILDRPSDLADDQTTLNQVLKYVLTQLGERPGRICQLLANCPLRTIEDIRNSADTFGSKNEEAMISVVKFGWTIPFRALREGRQGLELMFQDLLGMKRQSFPDCWWPHGGHLLDITGRG